jgi:hypothetical protein
VTVVTPPTMLVVTLKVALVAPAVTVTLAGVVADGLSSTRVTTAFPVGAGPLRVTVPVEGLPPATAAGLNVTDAGEGGLIVRVAVWLPLRVPVMVTLAAALTAMVVTVKVAVVAPAATVTLAGVVADALLSDKVTVEPPVGASPFKVTVPVEDVPPMTAVGLISTDASAGGVIVRVAVRLVPLKDAVTVTFVLLLTAIVVTVNVAVAAPAGTVTLAGLVADELLSERVITTPAAGAKPVKVTVPVEEFPPATLAGLMATDESAATVMDSVSVLLTPLSVAVIVAVTVLLTPPVATVKVPVVAPAATVMLAGTVAFVLLLESVTTVPPAPAGAAKVTVPVAAFPPTTDDGVTTRVESAAGLIVNVPMCEPL